MSLRTRLAGAVDVLLFNPPYVQTPSDEVILACSNVVRLQVRQVGGTGLSASWAGGINGREVVNCNIFVFYRMCRWWTLFCLT